MSTSSHIHRQGFAMLGTTSSSEDQTCGKEDTVDWSLADGAVDKLFHELIDCQIWNCDGEAEESQGNCLYMRASIKETPEGTDDIQGPSQNLICTDTGDVGGNLSLMPNKHMADYETSP